MLEIKPIMGSPVEDIFNFKTCCGFRAFDQNLEVLLTNRGDEPMEVPSHFDLVGAEGTYRVETLIPHGRRRIMPQATIAFYCQMDEERWKSAQRIIFYDNLGNRYTKDIVPEGGEVR